MSEQEKTEKLKLLVNEIADCDELSEEQVRSITELCDIDWDEEDIKMMCYEYWESPFSLDEVVYFLIHGEHKK